MSRYIDADKLKADIKEVADITDGKLTEFEVLGILSGQPTADVVEVVRCKDCKWRNGVMLKCNTYSDNDYCGHGERAES